MKTLDIYQVEQENSVLAAAHYIAGQLAEMAFFNQPAALFLSGGSNIQVADQLAKLIKDKHDLSQLHVLLADERVGVEPADLNEKQLEDASVWQTFKSAGAAVHLLAGFKQTDVIKRSSAIAATYKKVLDKVAVAALIAGVGDDGHTIGMLPTASASRFTDLFAVDELVTYYQVDPQDSANQFKERLTITMAALTRVDKVFLYAVGDQKLPQVRALQAQQTKLHQLPVLSLYLSQQPVTLITDQQL